MASVSVSPQGYVSHEFDSAGETDDSWQLLGSGSGSGSYHYASGCSNPNSVYFLPSPDGSLHSYVNVAGGGAASVSAPGSGPGSPLVSRLSPPFHLHPQHQHANPVPFRAQTDTPPTTYLAHGGDVDAAAAAAAAAYAFPAAATSPPIPTAPPGVVANDDIDMTMGLGADFMSSFAANPLPQFFDPQGFYTPEPQFSDMTSTYPFSFPLSLIPGGMETYQPSQQQQQQQQHHHHQHQHQPSPSTQNINFTNPQTYQPVDSPAAATSWSPVEPHPNSQSDPRPQPQPQQQLRKIPEPRPPKALEPRPIIIHESHYSKDPSLPRRSASPSTSSSAPRREQTRPVPTAGGRKASKPTGVQKTKRPPEKKSGFVVVTAEQVNVATAAGGRLDCFDGHLATRRGRKGPLATHTKESALEVRRVGACFCCRSRKVKCSVTGTCESCKKIMAGTPQVVCWRFAEFIPMLFPDFMRTHFRRDEMAGFMKEHVGSMPPRQGWHQIELHSGKRFSATLVLRALSFQPMDDGAHHGWHTRVANDQVDLYKQDSVPLVLDLETASQKDAVRRKVRDYVLALSTEPKYAEQLTLNLQHTDLPKKILTIVQTYARRTDSIMVRKALSICAAHYVLTHQLVFRNQGSLRRASVSVPGGEHPTSVVLNRQLKLLVDEHLAREVSALFDIFNRSLKPKSKREWTPCLAAFLALCLFMEDTERTTDMFVLSRNEISMRNGQPRRYTRRMVLEANEQVEKMPFQQFAWQFHHIYQTHSRDAGAKAFNPLVDDAALDMAVTDDGVAAREMIEGLRDLVGQDWRKLNHLVRDPILPNSEAEEHPWPRDVAVNYSGRLAARFLLSFKDERHIFGEMPLQGCVPQPRSTSVREWVNSQQSDMMDLSTA